MLARALNMSMQVIIYQDIGELGLFYIKLKVCKVKSKAKNPPSLQVLRPCGFYQYQPVNGNYLYSPIQSCDLWRLN